MARVSALILHVPADQTQTLFRLRALEAFSHMDQMQDFNAGLQQTPPVQYLRIL